ncbi:MAG: hypothetical protein HQL84_15570 [Magnetococcales bacterium]|nr:hypothetical protein [Magnetococcales bacterium]MBF0151439.1 hypothetical protein [Magnetococcales bacterium]MBF0174379.1 hypothetical protein [Magnetococcales bacterium]MBF0348931.1 hypothetical protein [Magnetococcales bacterium]MBF0632973.1 hypothetical protein [Magnetococcales bacterium]
MADGQHDSPEFQGSRIGESASPTDNKDSHTAAPTQLARRRLLLKGIAAGVPAIVTLQSGAALAAMSTSVNCISNGGGGPGINQPRCQASDPTVTSPWKHVIDNDASVWPGGNGPCATTTNYGIVYVDNSGTIITTANFGANGSPTATNPASGYYAIRQSCWTSFH